MSIDIGALPSGQPIDLVIDSTGLKVYGEGEWKTRCHGKSGRRTWRKLHLAIDAKTHEIVGHVLSESNVHDSEKINEILPKSLIGNVCADGAYNNEKSYEAIIERGGRPLIPPRSGAAKTIKPSLAMAYRNHTVEACWKFGRKTWKQKSGYHLRSISETGMFRFKRILGAHLASRKLENQQSEAALKSKIMNKITHLGMPKSYKKS